MTEQALERMAPERRRTLIRVAAEEFAAVGYERASLNVIIRRCGMSKSSFYYVITSKRQLYELVVRDLSAELAERIRIPAPAELAGPAFWPGIEELFARLLEAALQDEAMIALGRLTYGSAAATESVTVATLAAIEAWISAALEVGRSTGVVRDDLPPSLQRRLVFAVLRAMDEWSLTEGSTDPARSDAITRAQYDAVRRLLAVE